MFISTAIYPAIRSDDEQTFVNMSEESEKRNFIIKKSLQPVPSQGMVEQAKNRGGFKAQLGNPVYALRPQRTRWPRSA